MKVLVIGSGAREHAICWTLKRAPSVSQLFCAPGNPGIAREATIVPITVDQIAQLITFAKGEEIDLTVVGPEFPLSLGIVDAFQAQGLKIFGPSQAAAKMEASKSFAKEIMNAANVPTAKHEVYENPKDLRAAAMKRGLPLVLKADGLASGKGVFVCHTSEDLEVALTQLDGPLKATRVVVEDFLDGIEASFIVATDGERIIPLAPAHDYKRLKDKDQGPNTGGMGAVCPTTHMSLDQEKEVVTTVISPVLKELKERGTPFCGFLYAGLMISPQGKVSVVEFNARLGDPECQSILRRLETDFGLLMLHLLSQDPEPLSKLLPLKWKASAAVGIVLASSGYPEAPTSGDPIEGIEFAENIPDVVVFHAGTKRKDSTLVTAGGRVLTVTALGKDYMEARAQAYKASDLIQFRGRQCRRDIGIS